MSRNKTLLSILCIAAIFGAVRFARSQEITQGIEVGVTKIVAGTNVTIDPATGDGDVTINASGGASGGTTLPLPSGSSTYIENRTTLQSGATFFVSSGTAVNLYRDGKLVAIADDVAASTNSTALILTSVSAATNTMRLEINDLHASTQPIVNLIATSTSDKATISFVNVSTSDKATVAFVNLSTADKATVSFVNTSTANKLDTTASTQTKTGGLILGGAITASSATIPQFIGSTGTFQVVHFTTGLASTLYGEGSLFYDNTEKSLAYKNQEQDVTVNLGLELLRQVYNQSGATILNGDIVYQSGIAFGLPSVNLAIASDVIKADVLGIATHDIETNTTGYVTIAGTVHGLDTASVAVSSGSILYLSAFTLGKSTQTRPSQPFFTIQVGKVEKIGSTDGEVGASIGSKMGGAITVNRIPFGTSTGFSSESSSLTFTSTASIPTLTVLGNIGLGTALPSSKLDVSNGSITVRGNNAGINVSSGVSSIYTSVDGINNSSKLILDSGFDQILFKDGGVTKWLFDKYTTQEMDLLSSAGFWMSMGHSSGNLGIGGSAASSRFDVIDGSITVRGANAGIEVRSDGATSLRVSSSALFGFNGGLVGIGGITSPLEAVHVLGKVRVSTSTAGSGGCIRFNGTTRLMEWSNDCVGYSTFTTTGGNSGWIRSGSSELQSTNTDNVIIGAGGTSRATKGLTISQSTQPAFIADSDIGDGARICSLVNENGGNSVVPLSFRSNVAGGVKNQMLDLKFVNNDDNTSRLIYSFGPNAIFTDLFTMTSGGNFGIGTSTPADGLAVSPVSISLNNTSVGYGVLHRGKASGSNGTRIDGSTGTVSTVGTVAEATPGAFIEVGGGSLTDGFEGNITINAYGGANNSVNRNVVIFRRRVAAGTLADSMRISGDGLLGINTTSPSAMLQIATAAPQALVVGLGGNNQQLLAGTSIFAAGSGNASSTLRAILQGSNYSNLSLQSEGGNVAIGTYRASSLVDVAGGSITVRGTNAGLRIDIPNGGLGLSITGQTSSDPYMRVESDATQTFLGANNSGTGSGEGFVGTQNATHFGIRSNNVNRIFLHSGGNVGIGTVGPISKFNVFNGSVSITGSLPVIFFSTPTGTLQLLTIPGYAGFYSSATAGIAELWGFDGQGNKIQQTSHNHLTKEYWINSGNIDDGRDMQIDLERAIRDLQKVTGSTYLFENKPLDSPFSREDNHNPDSVSKISDLQLQVMQVQQQNTQIKSVICGNPLFANDPLCRQQQTLTGGK